MNFCPDCKLYWTKDFMAGKYPTAPIIKCPHCTGEYREKDFP